MATVAKEAHPTGILRSRLDVVASCRPGGAKAPALSELLHQVANRTTEEASDEGQEEREDRPDLRDQRAYEVEVFREAPATRLLTMNASESSLRLLLGGSSLLRATRTTGMGTCLRYPPTTTPPNVGPRTGLGVAWRWAAWSSPAGPIVADPLSPFFLRALVGPPIAETRALLAWWAVQDLNLRPHPCQGCALAT